MAVASFHKNRHASINDLRLFLECTSSNSNNYISIKIDVSKIERIKKVAVLHLKAKDFYQLKDMYEGVHYYEKIKTKLLALIAFEQFYGIEVIDWSKLEGSKNYSPEIIIDNQILNLISFRYGELPEAGEFLKSFFAYIRGERTVSLCGYADPEIIKENVITRGISSPVNNSNANFFTGFKFLKTPKNLLELKSLFLTTQN